MWAVLHKRKLSSSQIILFGFAGVILVGTLLLLLPFATNSGEGATFWDALFTSTSAVCVTGLIVQDTATYWSGFGQAVTPRTAGFNTADLTALSETGQTLTIGLMLIGGSPGSTAGGMKTTTVAVLFACVVAIFRRRENGRFFGRRIADDTVKNAVTVFLMYITLFLIGGMIISRVEGLPILTCLFETASAIGTVGLTLGIPDGEKEKVFQMPIIVISARSEDADKVSALDAGADDYLTKPFSVTELTE